MTNIFTMIFYKKNCKNLKTYKNDILHFVSLHSVIEQNNPLFSHEGKFVSRVHIKHHHSTQIQAFHGKLQLA